MTNNRPKIRFDGFTSNWEQRKLKELADFSKGNGYTKNDLTDEGKPIILYGRLYTNYETVIESVNTFTIEKENSVLSEGNEVIVPASGETSEDISRASVVSKSGVILGGDLNIVKPKNEIDSTFLALTISNGKQQKELSKRAQGKSVVHLHNSDLKEVNLLFPEKEEQTKIGGFFKKLDDTIALYQCELEKFVELKKAMLKKMFPQNGKSIPEIRFKGFTGDWKEHKLGEHSEIKTGGTPKTGISEYWFPKEIPWMSSGEVNKKRLSNTDNQISKKGLENSSARWIKEKSILIALAGQGKTRGTVAINEIPLTTNQSIAAIEVDSSLDSEFTFQNLESKYEELRMISSGDGTRGGLNKQLIADFNIVAPSVEEQSKIGLFFKQFDITISLQQEQLNKLKQIKKSMLQRMFS
ncbi:restriction endonuclease subunit S [Bacillus cereus]|uniref:restriction endonuclease subunit S n=1 Tax=Bacillus cereus TaxID=1396 RepID=UPI00387A183C